MGLMGRDVLHGQFPFFFYGQPFMGAVDGYLHAVPFALLGESVATLRLSAVLVSLGHVAVAALLARRVFGDGRWAAAVALVPSAYLLKWAADARLVYGLILVLTPLCLLLAMAAADSRGTRAGRARALVVLALVGGLAWWTNLLLAPVLLACALAILWRRPPLGRRWILVPLAFLLGSLPVWLFTVVYHRLPVVTVPLASWRGIADHARDLATTAFPLVAGVPLATLRARPLVALALTGGAIALVLALGDRRAGRVGRLLLGLVAAIALVTVLVTERGLTLATEDPRYLLSVLAIWPVLLGGALARVARRPAGVGRRRVRGHRPGAGRRRGDGVPRAPIERRVASGARRAESPGRGRRRAGQAGLPGGLHARPGRDRLRERRARHRLPLLPGRRRAPGRAGGRGGPGGVPRAGAHPGGVPGEPRRRGDPLRAGGHPPRAAA